MFIDLSILLLIQSTINQPMLTFISSIQKHLNIKLQPMYVDHQFIENYNQSKLNQLTHFTPNLYFTQHMSNPQLILTALQQTVQGTSTEAIKNAEALLKVYEDSPTFVDDIGLILEQSKVDSSIQKSAAVYLNKHATNVFKTKNQQLINTTAQKILKFLSSYKINIKHKVNITKSLQYMITADKQKIIRSAFEPNLIGLLIQTEQQTDDQINFEYLVFLGQILMNNPGFTEQVIKFIHKTFVPFIKLTLRVENLLKQVLEVQNAQLLLKLLFLTKEYFYLLKVYLKRFVLVDIESNKLMYVQELENVVTCGLELSLPQNLLSYPVFYMSQVASPYGKLINEVKSNCISFLTVVIRTLTGFIKQPKILQINPIFKKSTVYLQTLINASQQLMKNHPYYKIKDLSVLNTLDEVYIFFITSLRTNCFYQVFVQYKQKIIEDLIFRALVLTPNDYENYYEDPEEFINSLLHIIGRDMKVKFRRDDDEQEDEVQLFSTLRTYAAEFLNTFCKYQDGTLSEIMKFAKLIISGSINSQFSPSLMLFIVTILREVSKQRKDLHILMDEIVSSILREMQIPMKKTEQPQSKPTKNKQLDVQYSLGLLLLSKNFSYVLSVNPKIIDASFNICNKILSDARVEQVPKLLAINIIQVINHLEQGEPYSPEVLKTFNALLKINETPSHHLLQAYYSLIKYSIIKHRYNDVILKKMCYNQLVEMINTIASLIHQEVQKLQQSQNKEQITINKLWNVIRQVGENPQFIPLMIEPIQNAIMPLLPYIDSNIQVDFEEDILMLMSAFISKSHQVTQNQLKMFEIIPKIFYKQYKAVFGHSYQTMQIFIYYGKQILKHSPTAIKSIIHMGLTSISSKQYNGRNLMESDNCEGALLLQSLIAAVGLSIEQKDYEEIVETIRKRLSERIKFNLLRANLVALLTLVLIHSCDNFSNQVNDIILSSILNDISCFQNVKYAPKILIISLNKLLLKFQLEFVTRRYTQILDTIITLLQMIAMKKENLFDEDEDDEERDYQNSLVQTVNDIMKIDQFQDFRGQIKVLKEQNLQLIQQTVGELPQSKRDFLKNVLAVERVSNEPRKIFTIKRNK